MAKNTKQIALIQNRHGKANELPKQLSTGEFGFADDTNQLFIGNAEHPALKERLESNTFPYGNVEILTEFSDNTKLIKYSPFMNGSRIYFPVGVVSSKVNDVEIGQTICLNNEVITFTEPVDGIIGMSKEKNSDEAFTDNDFDYLILKLTWDEGKDLDTDIRFGNASGTLATQALGFSYNGYGYNGSDISEDTKSKQRGIPYDNGINNSYIYWSGDVVKSAPPATSEYILINAKKIFESTSDFSGNFVKIKLSGSWFTDNHGSARLELSAYKNGTNTIDVNREIINNGTQVKIKDSNGVEHEELEINIDNISDTTHEYKTIAYITLDKNKRTAILSLTDGEESSNTIDLYEVAKQINLSDVNVDAVVRTDNEIEFRTIENDLLIEYSENTALSNLGFDIDNLPQINLSKEINKRTIQEVLDDRYSVKSFDVLGDGISNDAENINNTLIMLYNYAKSDRKELFFPADTYIVDNQSLKLMSNTHLKGEGIDRTIIKSYDNRYLLVTSDKQTIDADNMNYCKNSEYPNNILVEDMTFDVSDASSVLLLGHAKNVTFKNCKFKGSDGNNIIESIENADLNNITFNNVIFEGESNKAIILNGSLDNMLITNCSFKNIQDSVIELNGNSDLIKNVIIANNRFENCSKISKNLIYVNENTKYVNVIKSFVDEVVLKELDEDGNNAYVVLNRRIDEDTNRYIDNNYCDTPIITTDKNKYLRFNYYQDIYDYVQALYNKYGHLALEVISPETDSEITNYFKLETGNDDNKDTLSLSSTSQTGNVKINAGRYADIHLGDLYENIMEWKPNYPYNELEVAYYEGQLYRCLEEHTSTDVFDESKWKAINNEFINDWTPQTSYENNDFVIYNGKIYKCKTEHVSDDIFDEMYWDEVGNNDTSIVFHKDIDVNDEPIKNGTGKNIVIQLENNNLIIDDSRSDTDNPYSKRAGGNPDSIATVGYVNEAVNNTIGNDFDTNNINIKVGNENSSEITLYDFDESYGNIVYLKNLSVNVRQMFIPISEQIDAEDVVKCSYLDWSNKIYTGQNMQYEEGDCIYYNDKYYECLEDYTVSGTSFDESKWEELDIIPDEYTYYTSMGYHEVNWYKGDVVKIEKTVEESNEFKIYFYVCLENHIASFIDEDDIISFENDLAKNYWKEVIIDVTDTQTVANLSDYNYKSNEEEWNIPYNANINEWASNKNYTVNTYVRYNYEIYKCITTHTSGSSFNTDYWSRSDYLNLTNYIGTSSKITSQKLREIINTTPDIKYIGIKSIDKSGNEPDKWLFDVNDVDLRYRNTNGIMNSEWQEGVYYAVNDVVSYNYSNYKCILNHISKTASSESIDDIRNARIDLHDSTKWKKLNESGYNYRYHFEKDLLVKNGSNFEIEDYMYRHNFANHILKLCLYDENCELLKVLNYDITPYFEIKTWNPYTTYYNGEYITYNSKRYVVNTPFTSRDTFETQEGSIILLQEIVNTNWVENTNYYKYQYIKNGDKVYQVLRNFKSSSLIKDDMNNLKNIPTKFVQIGPSGDLIVDIEYMRG